MITACALIDGDFKIVTAPSLPIDGDNFFEHK